MRARCLNSLPPAYDGPATAIISIAQGTDTHIHSALNATAFQIFLHQLKLEDGHIDRNHGAATDDAPMPRDASRSAVMPVTAG